MEIKVFSDLIDALGKVTSGLKSAASLPRDERDKYRQTMAENYRLIETTLNMIVLRLGDILRPATDSSFVQEVEKLDNDAEWLGTEREFRLCRSLYVARSEMENFSVRLKTAVSVRDVDALIRMMQGMMDGEGKVADFISDHFRELAEAGRTAGIDVAKLRRDVKAFRCALLDERLRLIKDEIELNSII